MKLLENEFTTYEFTDQELVEAAKLTIPQRAYIQHQIGVLCGEKVNMKFDPLNSVDFMQNEAHISGQIDAYRFLLSGDEQSAEIIKELQAQVMKDAKQRSGSLVSDPNAQFQQPPKPIT